MADVDFSFYTQEIKRDIDVEKKEYRTVSGVVRNCCAFSPLCEVTVKLLTDDDVPLAHTVTEGNGQFTIITEYMGKIKAVFYKTNYKTVYLATVDTNYLTISMCETDCDNKILEGSIFNITNKKLKLPIRVTLKAQNGNEREKFVTDDYKFYFSNVENGTYEIFIDGNEIQSVRQCINVVCNNYINYLQPIYIRPKKIYNTVNGVIKNKNTEPLKNNTVALFSKKTNKPISFTVTNENGEYFFGNLDNDLYYIKVYFN